MKKNSYIGLLGFGSLHRSKDLPEIQKQIEKREKRRKGIRAYKKSMAYLEKLLKNRIGEVVAMTNLLPDKLFPECLTP